MHIANEAITDKIIITGIGKSSIRLLSMIVKGLWRMNIHKEFFPKDVISGILLFGEIHLIIYTAKNAMIKRMILPNASFGVL